MHLLSCPFDGTPSAPVTGAQKSARNLGRAPSRLTADARSGHAEARGSGGGGRCPGRPSGFGRRLGRWRRPVATSPAAPGVQPRAPIGRVTEPGSRPTRRVRQLPWLLDALHARARAVVGPYGFSGSVDRLRRRLIYAERSRLPASLAPVIPQRQPAVTLPRRGIRPRPPRTLTHSTTNTQVPGVDEPDMAKTDGRYLVTLDGQLLHIVDVRTAQAARHPPLPQPGSELLLAGDHVVVLSGESSGAYSFRGRQRGRRAQLRPGALPGYGDRNDHWRRSSTSATLTPRRSPIAGSFNAGEIAARVVNGTIRLVLTSSPPQESWTQPRDSSAAEISRATKVNQQIVDATPL